MSVDLGESQHKESRSGDPSVISRNHTIAERSNKIECLSTLPGEMEVEIEESLGKPRAGQSAWST